MTGSQLALWPYLQISKLWWQDFGYVTPYVIIVNQMYNHLLHCIRDDACQCEQQRDQDTHVHSFQAKSIPSSQWLEGQRVDLKC